MSMRFKFLPVAGRNQGLADSFLIASVSEEDSILFSNKLFPSLEGTTVFTRQLAQNEDFWGILK